MSDSRPAAAETPPQTSLGEWSAIVGIVAVALWLRCGDLSWMEFKGDEAVALQLAHDMWDRGEIALTGLVSSLGVPNPPVFVYWIGLVTLCTRDPVLSTALAIAVPGSLAVFGIWWVLRRRAGIWLRLSAPLWMAVSPWAVLYNRKIWAQDAMPILCVALLGTLTRVSERPRSRAVFWIPVWVALLWQIHFSATGLALVAAAVLALRIRQLHWSALLAGIAVAIATLSPYLLHLVETDFADLDRMLRRPQHEAGARERISPAAVAVVTAREVAAISADTNLAYALGRSAADFADDPDPALPFAARAWGGRLGVACLALGSLLLAWRTARTATRRPFDTVLAVWLFAYPVYLWLGNVERIHPHYFLAVYPVPFIVAAGPADLLARTGGRAGRAAAAALLAMVVLAYAGTLDAFRAFVHERGGTAGDYGVAYRHKRELADWAVDAQAALVGQRGREIRFLMDEARAAGAGDANAAPRFEIVDHLRSGPEVPASCESVRRFGPLSACILD